MRKNNLAIFIAMPPKVAIMLKTFFLCLVIMLGSVSIPTAAESRDSMARADRLYAEGSMDSLKLSVKLYNQVAEKRPDSYQASWKGARSSRKITRIAVTQKLIDMKELCVSYGKQGMKMAQDAIDNKPEEVEGHFYYAVNVGGYAKGASIWTILNKNLKDKARNHLEKAYRINKEYNDFVVVMHMGFYYELLPWFAGQDKGKALEFYRKALGLMPEDARYRPQLHLLAGTLMLNQGVEENRAKRLLQEAVDSDSDYFSSKAREILAEHGEGIRKTTDGQRAFRESVSH